MTHSEKKSLYESIMAEVARVVKRSLNEAYESNVLKKFIEFSKEEAKKKKNTLDIHFIADGKHFQIMQIEPDGTIYRGIYKNTLSDLSDDNVYGKKFYAGSEMEKVLNGNSPSFKRIKDITVKNHLSCLVLLEWKKVRDDFSLDVIAGLFINPGGTKEIYDAIQKGKERQMQKVIKIEDDPKKIASIKRKDAFSKIKDEYDKFKKERGDKAALELSDTVNKLVGNKDAVRAMSGVLNMSLDKETATKYMYCFLLDVKNLWTNDQLKKDARFMKIYRKFHPDEK